MDNARMALVSQIENLIRQSRDAYYTEYLQGLLLGLQQQTITTEYAAQEVNRTYQLYMQRMQAYDTQQMQYAAQARQAQYAAQARQAQYADQARQLQYVQQAGKQEKKSAEFAIGAGVLSVVGVLFILIAFVMLGMTYMNGMIKGLCLYGIALAFLLFSELALNKRMPRFAVGITGLGICGLYLSTMLNCLYLGNFNGWIAMVVSVLIALVAVLISRKKDSGTIRIISFLGCYISLFPLVQPYYGITAGSYMGETVTMKFLVSAAILLVVNLMTVLLPVRKGQFMVPVFHMSAHTFFTLLYAGLAVFLRVSPGYVMLYVASALLVQGLIFYGMEREDLKTGKEISAIWIAVYACTGTLLCISFVVLATVRTDFGFGWLRHGAVGALLLVSILLFILFRKNGIKWIPYWMFSFTAIMVYNVLRIPDCEDSFYWWSLGVTIGVFLFSKLVSRIKTLRVSELVITCLTALEAMLVFGREDWIFSGCLLGAFLLSLAAVYYWKEWYEGIFLVVLEAFVLLCFRNELTVAIMMAILFLGMIGFSSISFFKGPYSKILNYICLGVMGCLYLTALFNHNVLSNSILLALGVALRVLAFREQFGMDFKAKNLIFMFFLCYMTMVWEIPVPVMKSIILMLIAVGAVATGFGIREKGLRISGLVLTLLVCGKVVLFDFPGAATTEKMILFLMVGLIALAISGIYIALEKKMV